MSKDMTPYKGVEDQVKDSLGRAEKQLDRLKDAIESDALVIASDDPPPPPPPKEPGAFQKAFNNLSQSS